MSRLIEAKRQFGTKTIFAPDTTASSSLEKCSKDNSSAEATEVPSSENTSDRTQVGAYLAQARLMFKSMRPASTLECLSRAKRAFTSESKMNKKSQVQEILFVNN